LVATAFGTCILTTIAIAGTQHGLELQGMRFETTKETPADLPRRIVRLATKIWLPIPESHPAAKPLMGAAARLPGASQWGLHPDVEKPIEFQWLTR
jgi:hypothetical protein